MQNACLDFLGIRELITRSQLYLLEGCKSGMIILIPIDHVPSLFIERRIADLICRDLIILLLPSVERILVIS